MEEAHRRTERLELVLREARGEARRLREELEAERSKGLIGTCKEPGFLRPGSVCGGELIVRFHPPNWHSNPGPGWDKKSP